MRAALVFSVLVASCWASTTTHRPHVSREPSEAENLTFLYLPKTHNLIIRLHAKGIKDCYVATLSPQQQANVHTDGAMRNLELHFVGKMSTATVVDASALDPAEVHACSQAHHNITMRYYTL